MPSSIVNDRLQHQTAFLSNRSLVFHPYHVHDSVSPLS